MSLSVNVWFNDLKANKFDVTIKNQYHSEEESGIWINSFDTEVDANEFATSLHTVLNAGVSATISLNLL